MNHVKFFFALTVCATAIAIDSLQAQTADRRSFTILAVEPRGGVNIAQEPFPTTPLPAGGGYVMRPPDQSGRWEVSAYVWSPSQIVVTQGDHVTLEFVGINGAEHPTEIKGLGHTFTLKRGNISRVEFTADKLGVFPIICGTHHPSMRGEIVVVQRN